MSDNEGDRTYLYRSLHEARLLDARAAIQAGLSINGLATTALLALLAATMKPGNHVPHALVWSLGCFGFGISCAACTAVAAYIANHRYAESASPDVSDENRDKHKRMAATAHRLGYGTAAGMLAGFLLGVLFVVVGIDHWK